MPDNEIVRRPKAEIAPAEATGSEVKDFMDGAAQVMQVVREMNAHNVASNEKVEIERIQSNERVSLTTIGGNHKQKIATFIIVGIITLIGGGGGVIALCLGKIDIGASLITGTVMGVFGFLGGKSLAGN